MMTSFNFSILMVIIVASLHADAQFVYELPNEKALLKAGNLNPRYKGECAAASLRVHVNHFMTLQAKSSTPSLLIE